VSAPPDHAPPDHAAAGAGWDSALLMRLLRQEEGLRLRPYRDTAGKLTIGIGRNLDDVGISEAEALLLLGTDVARAAAGLDAGLGWWRGLDPVRRTVLADMAFNLGVERLCGFTAMLAAARAGRWAAAAADMRASLWARQVGPRAHALAEMMETGREG